jgi:3-phosphoshikimate 1-carboxyvinyltransferase
MSNLRITAPGKTKLDGLVQLNGSKSISNRLLIIRAISGMELEINNLSTADDTRTMVRLLKNQNELILDTGDAGTTYRFLTAYLALKNGKHFLTGSKRMMERPIAGLVSALRNLGANINYIGKEGYPPLSINTPEFHHIKRPELTIPSDISSQYISALLLIAPYLEKGLQLNLEGEPVSEPYIDMTLALMSEFGADINKQFNQLTIEPGKYINKKISVESDWSAASYFYAIAALFDGPVNLKLKTLQVYSLQGDSIISKIMRPFGIETIFDDNGEIEIKKEKTIIPERFDYDFTNCPDLAQTLAVIVAALDIPSKLTGLKTLLFKETDRISALKTELEKFNTQVVASENSLEIIKGIDKNLDTKTLHTVSTYNDHRMAMAFAPLTLIYGNLKMENKEVVAKSYPAFWDDLIKLGFVVK